MGTIQAWPMGPWAHGLPPSPPRAGAKGERSRVHTHIPPLQERKLKPSMAAAARTAAAAVEEEEDQARMAAIADGLQTRDAMRLYNWLSQRCFSDCVTTFYRKSLGKGEADCVRACVRKYLLFTTGTAARFAELAGSTSSFADD